MDTEIYLFFQFKIRIYLWLQIYTLTEPGRILVHF